MEVGMDMTAVKTDFKCKKIKIKPDKSRLNDYLSCLEVFVKLRVTIVMIANQTGLTYIEKSLIFLS